MLSGSIKKIFIILVAVLVLGAIFAAAMPFGQKNEPQPNLPQIPEGNWKTVTDTEKGVSFQYPQKLMATYISTVDWPPQIGVSNEKLSCTEAGVETARAGEIKSEVINGNTYCATKVSEGAAGSIYTQYAYAFQKDSKVLILTFTLRAVQCANYDNPERTNCEEERKTFDIGGVADRIAQSARFLP